MVATAVTILLIALNAARVWCSMSVRYPRPVWILAAMATIPIRRTPANIAFQAASAAITTIPATNATLAIICLKIRSLASHPHALKGISCHRAIV